MWTARSAPFLRVLEQDVDRLHKTLVQVRVNDDRRLRVAKLEALAEFAAGASHEINNPLAVIAGQSQYMLTREPDYAHQQPSLTELKLRRLEVAAGAPTRPGKPTGVWATRERMRHAEKQLAAQAEASYQRSIADWRATSPNRNQRARA